MDKENKNIMIVDDDPVTATVLRKYLTNEGYEVTYCNSAIKGTGLLKSQFFPMVITDISMPDMGGLAFLKWINENTPKTDVILMTGFGTKEIKEAAKQRGASNFFEKPVDIKRLTQFVKSKFSNPKFTGSIREISLPEFIK
ncbi:response regulator, partial [bacterium]